MYISSTLFWLSAIVAPGLAQVDLGTAAPYGALAEAGITNTGPTIVNGDIGTTGAEIIGFPPGLATGTAEVATDDVADARADALTAYNTAQGLTGAIDSTANSELGGQTLQAGIYSYTSGVSLTGILTLDGAGSADAFWVFQIASTLITGSASSIVLINGASACNVYWAVGSSATLGSTSVFVGNILADQSISLTTGATVLGGLYAAAAITLEDNVISPGDCGSPPVTSTSSTISSTTSTTSIPITSTSTTSSETSTTSTSTLSSTTSTSTLSSTTSSTLSSTITTSTPTSSPTTLSTTKKTTSTTLGYGYTTKSSSSKKPSSTSKSSTKKTTSTTLGYGYTTKSSSSKKPSSTSTSSTKKPTSTTLGYGYTGYRNRAVVV